MISERFFKLEMNEVHTGPGEAAGKTFYIEEHLRQADRFSIIEEISRQYQQSNRHSNNKDQFGYRKIVTELHGSGK
jgi:hypothetical protein